MKKRFAVILCLALTLMTVAGCGAKETPQTEPEKKVEATQPKEEVKEETTVVEEVKEEPVAETDKVEEKEEVASDAAETASTTEEVAAAEEASTTEEVAEPAPEETGYIIDKYIEDGDFTDFAAYGAEIGATVPKAKNDWNIYYLFGDYFVTVGTNAQDATYAYIGIGSDHKITYCYLMPYKDVPTMQVYDTGAFIPTEAGHILEDTINYMKDHPNPNEKPSMPGLTWIGWDEW